MFFLQTFKFQIRKIVVILSRDKISWRNPFDERVFYLLVIFWMYISIFLGCHCCCCCGYFFQNLSFSPSVYNLNKSLKCKMSRNERLCSKCALIVWSMDIKCLIIVVNGCEIHIQNCGHNYLSSIRNCMDYLKQI